MDNKHHFRISGLVYRTFRYPPRGIQARFEDGGWLAPGKLMHLLSKSHADFVISRIEVGEILDEGAVHRFESDETSVRLRAKADADADAN